MVIRLCSKLPNRGTDTYFAKLQNLESLIKIWINIIRENFISGSAMWT